MVRQILEWATYFYYFFFFSSWGYCITSSSPFINLDALSSVLSCRLCIYCCTLLGGKKVQTLHQEVKVWLDNMFEWAPASRCCGCFDGHSNLCIMTIIIFVIYNYIKPKYKMFCHYIHFIIILYLCTVI